jgi:hypothetical protein
MKLKRSLSVLVFLLLYSNICNAQIVDRVKTLFYRLGMTQYPNVFSDSVMITKVSNDTTWFNTTANHPSGKGYYYRAGLKIYRVESQGNILYYDYSLVKGDSFFCRLMPYPDFFISDTFIVDSVYTKKLSQHTFKAWRLKQKRGGHEKWEWLEGLGEFTAGWDLKSYLRIDNGWMIKGICLHDSVLYWYDDIKYFGSREPSPTCNLDDISKTLGVEKVHDNAVFCIYPNPANGPFSISSAISGETTIYDLTGKICIGPVKLFPGINTIETGTLESGAYMISVQNGGNNFHQKILVIRE